MAATESLQATTHLIPPARVGLGPRCCDTSAPCDVSSSCLLLDEFVRLTRMRRDSVGFPAVTQIPIKPFNSSDESNRTDQCQDDGSSIEQVTSPTG